MNRHLNLRRLNLVKIKKLVMTVGLSRGTDPKTVLKVIRNHFHKLSADLVKATGCKNTKDTEWYLTGIWDRKVASIGGRGRLPSDIDVVTIVVEGERHAEYIVFGVSSDDYIGRGDAMEDLELK